MSATASVVLSLATALLILGTNSTAIANSVTLTDATPATLNAAIAANCSSTGACEIKLPCETGISTAAPIAGKGLIEISDMKHVTIRGCGMNGTTVRWDVDATTETKFSLLEIDDNSRFITIEDLRFEMRVKCDTTVSSCTGYMYGVNVNDGSRNINFNRVHFHTPKSAGAFGSRYPVGLQIGGTEANPIRVVKVTNGLIHSSGYGQENAYCDDCLFDGNWFGVMEGPIDGWEVQRTATLSSTSMGSTVKFISNTFDWTSDVTDVIWVYGFRLGGQNVIGGGPGIGLQLIGNSFIGMKGYWTPPVSYSQYRNSLFLGNYFVCAEGASCRTAINMSGSPLCLGCTRENVIVDNNFTNFSTAGDATGSSCPIYVGRNDRSLDNVIRDNVAQLNSGSGQFMVCGDVADNIVEDNIFFIEP